MKIDRGADSGHRESARRTAVKRIAGVWCITEPTLAVKTLFGPVEKPPTVDLDGVCQSETVEPMRLHQVLRCLILPRPRFTQYPDEHDVSPLLVRVSP